MSFSKKFLERFWAKVRKGEKCWEWLASRTQAGYGQIQCRSISQKPLHAHRVSWEIKNGPVPDRLHVLHRCDNPACVNPDHLFLGTHRDNIRDRCEKGRTASGDQNGARTRRDRNPFVRNHGSGLVGEEHPNSKLSQKQVDKMRREFANGTTKAEISRRYGISQTTAGRIVMNMNWKVEQAK